MLVTFVGDISLNDDYIRLFKEGKHPFAEIEPVLADADFVVGNLECMGKGDQGENELKKPRLTTTLETLNYLKNIRLKVASLAHNHVYDHLEDGFLKTINFLKANEIKYLGAGFTPEEAAQPVILKQGDISVGLLNYVTADTNPNLPENAGIFLNVFDFDKCKNDILALKPQVNHVVLLLHWGGRVEGGLYPDWDQPRIGRALIDVGADLIIGHHSHTIQPYEVYKGKHIFYSLGNFCFSDYWFDGQLNPMPERRMITALLMTTFRKEDYNFSIDYYINNRTNFNKVSHYQQIMARHNWTFSVLFKFRIIWVLYYHYFKKVLPIFLFLNRNDISLGQKIIRLYKSLHKRGLKYLSNE